MNSLGSKLATNAVTAALMAVVFSALPIKMDAQHPIGYSSALASDRHDFANAYNNNTDNYGHEQNQDEQYNGK